MRHTYAFALAASLTLGACQEAGQVVDNAIPQTVRREAVSIPQQLQDMKDAQERYYSDHGTYTTDVAALSRATQAVWMSDQVEFRLSHADVRTWAGEAFGARGVQGSCVVYVGFPTDLPSLPATRQAHLKPTEEGGITCDP